MKIQSFSDIITNSSSELFVFNDGKSAEEVINLLNEIYPEWRNEYELPNKLEDCNDSQIEIYCEYNDWGYYVNLEKERYCKKHNIAPSYIFMEHAYYDIDISKVEFDKNDCFAKEHAESYGLTPEEMYVNWDDYNPFSKNYKNNWLTFSEKYIQIFKEQHKDEVLLFSIDENPNWDYQEKLMKIAKRYHLG
ncbi:MAG: hypothetical protein [Wendovervirus sonii]|uniref:Uncharacterized protein n=1 Tax=phage Lak_Megaphage_Sonny TaxID=3109229 RepID=A0ABZ0Z380_9CAUD|nr:MAG: hypothetical protein [phage Lak_Megaphage_Sonny]